MADALILGGGLSGSTAACLLARAGHDVQLIERETGPHHKVCGEFLSIEAVAHLRQLGLDPVALGAAPIERIRLVSGNRETEAPLPFGALGLSRHVLDEALLDHARAAGARIECGVRVLALDGATVRTSSGEREASHLLLATGKLPVRENGTAPATKPSGRLVGFKMHYRLAPQAARRLAGTIALALFDGGYAGLQMIEAGRANLCLVIQRAHLQGLGGDWPAVRAWLDDNRILRDMLADAEPLLERPATIANLEYGLPPRDRAQGSIYRLGDRWAMTASLTGDGMAIALRSAFVAARCLQAGEDALAYDARMAAEARRQITRAMALQNGLALAPLRSGAMSLARLYPPLLTLAARMTRLPQWSDRRA